jgi:hypothetical protein
MRKAGGLSGPAGADRRAPGHQHLAAGFQQPLGHDEIVGGVGEDLEAFACKNARRLDQAEDVGLQRVVVADDLELDPVGGKHLARHLRRQHRFGDGVAAGGVGQDPHAERPDHIQNAPPLRPPAVSRRSETVTISLPTA